MSEHGSTGQKDLVRNLYRTVYEQESFDAVPEFYTSGAVRHGGLQGTLEGREAIEGYLRTALGGFSDVEVTELHCLAEDDLVAYDFESENWTGYEDHHVEFDRTLEPGESVTTLYGLQIESLEEVRKFLDDPVIAEVQSADSEGDIGGAVSNVVDAEDDQAVKDMIAEDDEEDEQVDDGISLDLDPEDAETGASDGASAVRTYGCLGSVSAVRAGDRVVRCRQSPDPRDSQRGGGIPVGVFRCVGRVRRDRPDIRVPRFRGSAFWYLRDDDRLTTCALVPPPGRYRSGRTPAGHPGFDGLTLPDSRALPSP